MMNFSLLYSIDLFESNRMLDAAMLREKIDKSDKIPGKEKKVLASRMLWDTPGRVKNALKREQSNLRKPM
ncbi:hypothetical protein EON64_00745 [archaeon]|nr:MAG: hypothetical protein EON64_00745 [archaeon]